MSKLRVKLSSARKVLDLTERPSYSGLTLANVSDLALGLTLVEVAKSAAARRRKRSHG